MHKSPKDWSAVIPEMVTSGSVAQATNVLRMALQDVAELGKALAASNAALEEAREYFAERADAEYFSGVPVGNPEMRLLVEINAVLASSPEGQA